MVEGVFFDFTCDFYKLRNAGDPPESNPYSKDLANLRKQYEIVLVVVKQNGTY